MELGDRATFPAHFFVRPVMFCHVLFGTFSRFAWSPLERQDTADGGPLSPLFCLSRPPRWRRMWRHGPAPHGLASGAGRLRRLGALPASRGAVFVVDCALGSFSARSVRALGGGCCGLVSLDLGVSAVASEVTARTRDNGEETRVGGGGCMASAGWRSADAARELEARSSRTRLASRRARCARSAAATAATTRSPSASAPSPLRVEVTARRAVARGLGSRRRLLGVGRLEAGRRRTRARGAIIARSARFSARSLRALGGGYGGDDSLALGVGAVASMC